MRDPTGMTLRDYFAAKAMQGQFASDSENWNEEGDWEYPAHTAYESDDSLMNSMEQLPHPSNSVTTASHW